MILDYDPTGYAELAERLRAEWAAGVPSAAGMRSVFGWHTHRHQIGVGWLGEAVRKRLELAGRDPSGCCWGNILPPGAEYKPHRHDSRRDVAVWCLVGDGELRIEPNIVVPDRPGQLVIFSGSSLHWVPTVTSERITVAANLN